MHRNSNIKNFWTILIEKQQKYYVCMCMQTYKYIHGGAKVT
jgi:hypothetical protein